MKKDVKSYLLVDGEGLLHQSFHKFLNFKTPDGKPSGAIYGFFKSLHHYIYRFHTDGLFIVFDNGHSKYRKEVLPNYKAHRKNISIDYESLQSQKKVIIKICRLLRINYIFDKEFSLNYEGDDFLAYLTLKYLPKKSKITIITADKDFNQLLKGNTVKVFNPRKDQLVFESNCKELYGYSAKETVDYLSLVGDSSDDIPGYRGMGPAKTRQFLDKYGSIENYLNGSDYLKGDDNHQKMLELFNRNRLLIDLKYYVNKYEFNPNELPLKTYKDPVKIKLKEFTSICNEYSLGSFLNNNFIKTYEEQILRSYGK